MATQFVTKDLLIQGTLDGTPSGGTVDLSSCTVTTGTQRVTAIELGHASDTTIARASAGVVTIEGVTAATASNTLTLTNKTISGASNTITNVSLTSGVTGTLPIANGGTGTTTKPSFAAYCSGSTTITTGGATKIAFATEDFDIASNYDTSTSRFTAPIAGKYRFNVSIIVSGNLGANAELYFTKNGTKEKSVYYHVSDPNVVHLIHGSIVLSLAANDYVEVYAYNDSGSSRTAYNYQAYTQFAGELITP